MGLDDKIVEAASGQDDLRTGGCSLHPESASSTRQTGTSTLAVLPGHEALSFSGSRSPTTLMESQARANPLAGPQHLAVYLDLEGSAFVSEPAVDALRPLLTPDLPAGIGAGTTTDDRSGARSPTLVVLAAELTEQVANPAPTRRCSA